MSVEVLEEETRGCCNCRRPIKLEIDEGDPEFERFFGVRCWYCAHFYCGRCAPTHFMEWKKWVYALIGTAVGAAAMWAYLRFQIA